MPKDKPKSELALARVGKVGKISIVGVIGWDYFGMSYRGYRDKLKDLGAVNVLEVDITSDGGIITDGVAIMNSLVEHEATVHVFINGMAASIASVIAMAGDRIFMPTNSLLMVHKPLSGLTGNADDMRQQADVLDKFESTLVASYNRHFNGTDEEIKALMTAETYLTAAEASEKFSNITVMEQAVSEQVAAHGDPIAIFGNLEAPKETILDKAVNAVRKKVTGNDPKEVDMTPEQTQAMEDGIVAKVTASVIAALKPVEKKPEPKIEPAPVAKVEIAFVGDMSKAEDVQAHADKVALAELTASADMSTLAGVVAYQAALAKHQGKEVIPASAQAQGTDKIKAPDGERSQEDIDACVARQCGTAK